MKSVLFIFSIVLIIFIYIAIIFKLYPTTNTYRISIGIVFTRCGLVDQLRKNGFPETKMRDWVCLVESESQRRTDVVGPVNSNGSRDYGLFQINDHYWCSNTTVPGKDCHVTCADLITDDITKASICAKTIFNRQGFIAWHGWERACQGTLPDISMC